VKTLKKRKRKTLTSFLFSFNAAPLPPLLLLLPFSSSSPCLLGFDFLGCAVDGLGDFVSLSVDPNVHPGQISISHISGDAFGKLSKNPNWNCAGIAAIEVMKMLGVRSVSLSLSLQKDLPLGSDLGSSAAATAVVVNEIFGGRLRLEELVLVGLKSEERVSG
jgi:homoserine kinase